MTSKAHEERREKWLNEYINLKFSYPAHRWNEDAKARIRESFAFNRWCLKQSLKRLGRVTLDAIKHTYGGKQ